MEHFLTTLRLMQARWWIAEAAGGPSYAEQADAFLDRVAADFPAELVNAMRRVLAAR